MSEIINYLKCHVDRLRRRKWTFLIRGWLFITKHVNDVDFGSLTVWEKLELGRQKRCHPLYSLTAWIWGEAHILREYTQLECGRPSDEWKHTRYTTLKTSTTCETTSCLLRFCWTLDKLDCANPYFVSTPVHVPDFSAAFVVALLLFSNARMTRWLDVLGSLFLVSVFRCNRSTATFYCTPFVEKPHSTDLSVRTSKLLDFAWLISCNLDR